MSAHVSAEPNAALRDLLFLLGTWSGRGQGRYPEIEDFSYGERTRFWHDGRPLLFYLQETFHLDTGAAMHSESGYWRPQPDGGIEIVLSHSLGIAEIEQASIRGNRIESTSTHLIATPTAKPIAALARTFEVDGDMLRYDLRMAFGEHDLQPHLAAELRRQPEERP